ncbi:class F sortase [Streptomyces albiaxialis]|uniref:Class F sortase n=1 Tax=Streptomyces albiaxialis TaxID=329523 RepID=A0ABN2WE83_9ACTN
MDGGGGRSAPGHGERAEGNGTASGGSASGGEARTAGRGRLITGAAWVVLLLGLWLWGRNLTDGGGGPVLGDVSRAGRLAAGLPPLPAAHDPLDERSRPTRIDIGDIGVHARVIRRGVDREGAVDAPAYAHADRVGWYARGPAPGEKGAALLVGHVDTDERRAVFYALSTVKPGTGIRVRRADGTVAEFTVERTRVVGRGEFDADRVYGTEKEGRAELRLITCGGEFDRVRRVYSSNVVVSAYLTGVSDPN